MDKRKKIIISLVVALVILLGFNYIIISYTNSDYIEIPVFKEPILKGKIVESKNVGIIQVKKTNLSQEVLKGDFCEKLEGKTLKVDVIKGEIVTEDKFLTEDDLLEQDTNYKYISIPINNLSYPTCSKLERGDIVTIYYTAKSKDVSNAIKNKQRLYSNTDGQGLVTCMLFEGVEVISIHDSTGKETKDNIVTDVLLRLDKEQAMLVANLKSQGTFDIVLN